MPIVEKWNNDKVDRVEIQIFAHMSNNRKTNPLASVLNAMEILKIKPPASLTCSWRYSRIVSLS
jgi:hypothetical protein